MVKTWSDDDVWARIRTPHEQRIFALAEALRRGAHPATLAAATGIDPFFLDGIARIVGAEAQASRSENLDGKTLSRLLRLGFDDRAIAHFAGLGPRDVRTRRMAAKLTPTYKSVDTCAGEFKSATPYFYSTYEEIREYASGPWTIVDGGETVLATREELVKHILDDRKSGTSTGSHPDAFRSSVNPATSKLLHEIREHSFRIPE